MRRIDYRERTGTCGAGDINVDAAISWSTAAQLTLSAFHSIIFNAPMTIAGSATLCCNQQQSRREEQRRRAHVHDGPGQRPDTGGHGAGARLTIDGQPYTLLYEMTTNPWGVQSMNGSSGNFALATSVTAPTTAYATACGSFIYWNL